MLFSIDRRQTLASWHSDASDMSYLKIAEDLATEAGCKRLAEEFMKKESKLHILVNNSGTSWGEPLEKFSEKGFDKVMALNVKAPFFLTRNLLPALDAGANPGDPARVIMIGSIVGRYLLRPIG